MADMEGRPHHQSESPPAGTPATCYHASWHHCHLASLLILSVCLTASWHHCQRQKVITHPSCSQSGRSRASCYHATWSHCHLAPSPPGTHPILCVSLKLFAAMGIPTLIVDPKLYKTSSLFINPKPKACAIYRQLTDNSIALTDTCPFSTGGTVLGVLSHH